MRYYAVLMILLSGPFLVGQNLVHTSTSDDVHASDFLPHPYVFAGPEGMGSGYAPFALIGGAGFRIDSRYLIVDANGWYDNGHKASDNDQPNPGGHDRGLVGSAYLRIPSGWFFGGGVRWSQLSTTNYTKAGSRPTFGGGKDLFLNQCEGSGCRHGYTMRVTVDYVLPGADWENGSQGPLISFWEPSPYAKRHIFFRANLGIYRFHDTVTNRADPILTKEEMSNHAFDSFCELTLVYRF